LDLKANMSRIFRARKNENNKSGGKMVRGRRVVELPSPVDNNKKLLGLISPASRIITGAGKMISTVFFPDSPSSSSEDESDDDDDDDDDYMSTEVKDRSNQNGATLEANKCSENYQQLIAQKDETKVAIERLLMQVTFSRRVGGSEKEGRISSVDVLEWFVETGEGSGQGCLVVGEEPKDLEDTLSPIQKIIWNVELYLWFWDSNDVRVIRDECNRIVKIVESRVMESPALKEGEVSHGALGLGVCTPDMCNTAVMEAKKWVQEKKLESYSQWDRSPGTFASNTAMLSSVTEGESGSPVLMAKSYMKSRPPWASPTIGRIGFQSSSPIGTHLLKEETPYSGLKRSYLAFDSWNTLEGTRRVRFKSTEDFPQPLSENDDSQRDCKTSAASEKRDVELGSIYSKSLPLTDSVNQSAHLSAALATTSDFPLYEGSGNEALSTSFPILSNELNQDLRGAQVSLEGKTAVEDLVSEAHDGLLDQSALLLDSHLTGVVEDVKPALGSDSNDLTGVNDTKGMKVTRSSEVNQCCGLKEADSFDDSQADHALQKELNGSRDRIDTNGFSSARVNAASNPEASNDGAHKLISSSDGKLEGSCELLSEASVEIPVNKEIDSIPSGSQNNSSKNSRDVLNPDTSSVSSRSVKKRSNTTVEKQVEKKVARNSRRGRGRGRGKCLVIANNGLIFVKQFMEPLWLRVLLEQSAAS
ncbi:hypothetical protein IFM89_028968, partial [Coptis chinensis]